jgi:hypothetical protein
VYCSLLILGYWVLSMNEAAESLGISLRVVAPLCMSMISIHTNPNNPSMKKEREIY